VFSTNLEGGGGGVGGENSISVNKKRKKLAKSGGRERGRVKAL